MALTTTIEAITRKYFVPSVTDNIHESNPVYARLKSKNQVSLSGGERIEVPVRYQKISATGWFEGTDTLSTTAVDAVQAAEFTWKNIYGMIIINGDDKAKNQGKEQVVSLAKEKMEQVKIDLEDQLAIAFFNDGTTITKAPQGLRLAANITGTYGAIAKGSSSWWQGNEDSASTTVTLALLNGSLSDINKNDGKASVMYCTYDILDNIHNLIQPQERYVDSKMADAGFQNIAIKGVPVIADSHVPTNHLFMVDEKYLKFYVNKNRNMSVGKFIEPINQDIETSKVITMCALVDSKPKTLAYFTSLSA